MKKEENEGNSQMKSLMLPVLLAALLFASPAYAVSDPFAADPCHDNRCVASPYRDALRMLAIQPAAPFKAPKSYNLPDSLLQLCTQFPPQFEKKCAELEEPTLTCYVLMRCRTLLPQGPP